MRTLTQKRIIEIIRKSNRVRPRDLVKSLGISPQAVHRHLKVLLKNGQVENLGKPPLTFYALVGVPDFEGAFGWINTGLETQEMRSFVCETRDVFSGRLARLKEYQMNGLSRQDLGLMVAIVGEIGNNSFDHNLGQWTDVPGCWFQSQLTGKQIWIVIADRGQGIYQSLLRVDSQIQSHQAAVEMAFEKKISGRKPERRGNGLKFVKSVIVSHGQSGLACRSGSGWVHYGSGGAECANVLKLIQRNIKGTLTLMTWGFK
jgi:predicted DNA-binding transcriptional regulator